MKTRKMWTVFTLVSIFALIITACAAPEPEVIEVEKTVIVEVEKEVEEVAARDPLRVALLMGGPVSDASWSANAYKGLMRLRDNYGADVAYSENERDLGNIADYEQYIEALASVFAQIAQLLRPGKHATVVLQNIRTREGVMAPLAWEVALRMREHFRLMQETIWCQDKKRLGCWGYPTTFVSNVHHHYCLTFQKHRE